MPCLDSITAHIQGNVRLLSFTNCGWLTTGWLFRFLGMNLLTAFTPTAGMATTDSTGPSHVFTPSTPALYRVASMMSTASPAMSNDGATPTIGMGDADGLDDVSGLGEPVVIESVADISMNMETLLSPTCSVDLASPPRPEAAASFACVPPSGTLVGWSYFNYFTQMKSFCRPLIRLLSGVQDPPGTPPTSFEDALAFAVMPLADSAAVGQACAPSYQRQYVNAARMALTDTGLNAFVDYPGMPLCLRTGEERTSGRDVLVAAFAEAFCLEHRALASAAAAAASASTGTTTPATASASPVSAQASPSPLSAATGAVVAAAPPASLAAPPPDAQVETAVSVPSAGAGLLEAPPGMLPVAATSHGDAAAAAGLPPGVLLSVAVQFEAVHEDAPALEPPGHSDSVTPGKAEESAPVGGAPEVPGPAPLGTNDVPVPAPMTPGNVSRDGASQGSVADSVQSAAGTTDFPQNDDVILTARGTCGVAWCLRLRRCPCVITSRPVRNSCGSLCGAEFAVACFDVFSEAYHRCASRAPGAYNDMLRYAHAHLLCSDALGASSSPSDLGPRPGWFIGNSRIVELDLSGCTRISGINLRLIAMACPKLLTLQLAGCVQITSVALASMCAALPNVRFLNLDYCSSIDDMAVFAIAEHCSKLARLQVRRCFGCCCPWECVCVSVALLM